MITSFRTCSSEHQGGSMIHKSHVPFRHHTVKRSGCRSQIHMTTENKDEPLAKGHVLADVVVWSDLCGSFISLLRALDICFSCQCLVYCQLPPSNLFSIRYLVGYVLLPTDNWIPSATYAASNKALLALFRIRELWLAKSRYMCSQSQLADVIKPRIFWQ